MDLVPLEGRALPTFVAAQSFDTGASAISPAVGEFDGDGIPDLAVANYWTNNVSVLRGNGDGTFQPALNFDVGANPYSVATGEFDGNGSPDLVVVNYNSNTVSVLLGNGDGTFQPALTFSVGSYPRSVAVGQFDGDGSPDLAVANQDGNVSVLLGNGDGTFQPATGFPAGSGPFSVAVADLDGNGVTDLAVSNFDSATVSVLLGDGDGTFQAPRQFATETESESVVVADFDGDGIADLAAANSYSESVSVLLGNGDGNFQAARHFAAGSLSTAVAAGDFDGDGRPDLVVGNQFGDSVSVLLGNGDGTFQGARDYFVGTMTAGVAVGEFNGDGIADVAAATFGNNTVAVLLGAGDGTFRTARHFLAGETPWSVVAGDVNADGALDLAVANRTIAGTVSVLLGSGDGAFQPPRSFAVGSLPSAAALGDFNEDGHPDLVVTNYNSDSFSLLPGNGDGTFQAARHFGSAWDADALAVADFNGDGHLDVAMTSPSWGEVFGINLSFVTIRLGNGDGTFPNSGNHNVEAYPHSMTVGDVNGDDIPDLVLAVLGGVRVALGDGDGFFRTAAVFAQGTDCASVAVADLDGDGHADIAVGFAAGAVGVLRGHGDGTFDEPVGYPAGTYAHSVAVADFDGDAVPDIVTTSAGVRLLTGNGDGTFQATHVGFVAGSSPRSLAVGDFDGDGWPDLAVANAGSNDVSEVVSVLLNDPPTAAVTVEQAAGQVDPAAGPAITFDVRFEVPVTGFEAADVDLSGSTTGGTLVPTVTGSGTTYTITVTGMAGAGTVVVAIPAGAAVDGSGVPTQASTSTDNSVTFDPLPAVAVDQAAGQPDPTNVPAVVFDVRFSEPVTGFDAADVSLAGSTAGGTLSVAVTGSGDAYTIAVTGMTGSGLVTAAIPPGVATDATGNANLASTSADNAVEFRNTGTLGFARAVFDAAEDGGAGTVTLTVTRTGGTDGAVSVRYATSPGTAQAGTDFEFTSDVLTWAAGEGGDRTFTIPVLPDTLNEGKELFHVTLNTPVGLPALGLTAAVVAIAPSDGTLIDAAARRPFAKFTDTDGDVATVRLGGRQGTATVYRTDPDGDGRGPIEWIELAGTLPDPTRPRATLGIAMARAKTSQDGGTIELGAVAGTGLRAVNARRANLTGDGIRLNGYLGSLVIGNVTNGADITTGPGVTPVQRTRISALAVGDGTAVDVAAPISGLTAMSFGAGSVRAPGIGTLSVRGNLAADVTVTGAGVDPARNALGTLRVTGTVTGSDISVAGGVGSVVVGAFRGSRLFAGYTGPDIPDPAGFNLPATVGAFRTTGRFDAFQDSRVVATAFRSVVLSSLDMANDGNTFGFYADTSLGAVTALSPTRFRYDPVLPTPQGIGDFEVKLV